MKTVDRFMFVALAGVVMLVIGGVSCRAGREHECLKRCPGPVEFVDEQCMCITYTRPLPLESTP